MKKGWILWILGMLSPLIARPIHTWSGVVDPAHVPQKALATYARSPYRLLQFPGPIQESWRRALEAQGIRIYRYFPEYTYLVRVPSEATLQAVKAALPVEEDLPYLPAFKIKPDIGTHTFQNPERKMDNRWWLSVEVFRDADLAAVMDRLEQLGAEIETWTNLPEVKRVWIRVPKDQALLRKLAAIPEVEYIEERLEYVKLNDRNRWVLQGNVQNPMDTTVWSHGIHGEGQVVAVMDSDLNEGRCWFQGKTISNTPAPGSPTGTVDYCAACEHGTHVAGTVLGKDASGANAAFNGMAYEAQLVFQDIQAGCGSTFLDVPSSLLAAFDSAYAKGARVHTNSWGSNSNTYTTYAQEFDDFLFTHQDMIFTIAMGNNSSATASEDGTIGSPATAKNAISVGATNKPPDQDTRAFYSSQGPTYDGRTKPDVMAPGGDASANQTNSADESQACGTCAMSGTSMATPAVAGTAALVRQYFTDGYYPSGTATPADAFTPLGSLVKAMLVNSGEPMVNEPPIPNSEIGWGRIKLRNVLYFPGDPYKLYVVNATAGPTTGQTLTYTISVDQGYPLKVTLAWYDASGQNLVNNLDLEVVDPNGTIYKGNVFSNGWSTTGGTADNKNTVEAVRIQNPTPGTWTIYVKGTNVPTPANNPYSGQPFGLVATYKELPIVNAPAIVTTPPDTVFMNSACGGSLQDSVKVSNVGNQTLNVTNVRTTQSPRLIIDGPKTFSLNQNQFQWVRFHIDTTGLAIGQYYLGDVIIDNNDPDPQDNPKKVMVKLALSYSYDPATDYGPDNLEANDGGWVSNNTNGWQWGAPSGTSPAAHSGTNVWGTVLAGDYATNNADWTLDKTFYRNYYCGTPYLVVWHSYNTENTYDGGNVKYSLDGGTTWTLLTPRRGYDGPISTGFGSPIAGQQAFTGNSNGWISDTFDLSFFTLNSLGNGNNANQILANPGDSIIIRFEFATDQSVNNFPGWYIDDIQAVGLSPTPVVGMGGTVTGTEEQPGRASIFRMINPPVTRGNLHLRFQLPRGGKLRVALYDEAGRQARKLFEGVVGPGVQEIQEHLDVPAGVYFLKVNAGSTTFKRRLVIVH